MRKIPTLFKRVENGKLVYNEVNEGCEWVFAGEGVATTKWDGTCCMVRNGVLYARYQPKVAPTPEEAALIGFIPLNDDGEEGHRHGWRLVNDSPSDKYHREAWAVSGHDLDDWTYELVGPKVQGNPYGFKAHGLLAHGVSVKGNVPRTFDSLRDWLAVNECEGIVWWRDLNDVDCDKVKIKRRDFGLQWPVKGK